MGLPIPEEYGGAGGDTVSYAIAIEELTRIDSSVAITVAAHTSLGTMPILLYGIGGAEAALAPRSRVGAKARRLRAHRAGCRLGRGRDAHDGGAARRLLGRERLEALHHERGHGHHLGRHHHRAHRRGRGLEPRGRERHSRVHDLRADEEARLARVGHAGAVLRGLRGSRGQPPRRARRRFRQFLEILDGGRISVAAMGVGLAQGAYDLAFAYAREREQFGKPIARFQAVQFKLADMATEIEAGRALVYRAAWLKDQGRPFAREAAMAKLYTGELSARVAGAALQLHGGFGYMEECGDLAPLPRSEDPRDRRGHERGAAHGHRAPPRPLTGRATRAAAARRRGCPGVWSCSRRPRTARRRRRRLRAHGG